MTWYDICLSISIIVMTLFVLLGNGIKTQYLEVPRYLPPRFQAFLIVAGLVAIIVWQAYLLFFR